MDSTSLSDSDGALPPPAKEIKKRGKRPIKQEDSEYEVSHDDASSAEDVLEEEMPGTSEMNEEVQDISTNKKTPKRKKVGDGDTFGPYHFKNNITNTYMPFVPYRWTPQSTYRLPCDLILDTIRRSGTEGLGRSEIGQVLGYDATTKSGGRKVTNYLGNCQKEHPDHIGQFQKMNGKVRTIRYFWKESEQPEKFEELFNEFLRLSGTQCPFKIGEVIKFPEKNLNTLRVSDISLKRFNRLLKMVNEKRVVVTMNRVIKMINEAEQADGYKFQIDKKSVLKCLLALQNKGFAKVWETTVRSDNVNYQVQIVTHGEINSVDDPEIRKAIQEILDSYCKEGRVFPHGQLRHIKRKVPDDPKAMTEFDGKIEDVDEDLTRSRRINDRFHFFRLQVLRNSWKGRNMKEDGETIDDEDEQEDTLDDSPDNEDATIAEDVDAHEEDPEKAMLKLFAKNPTIPEKTKKSSQFYFGKDSLGYQGKTIRLLVLHEMAYHFVHGHPDGQKPNVFDLFPPTQAFENWEARDEDSAHMYMEEESPYRFMPPQPQYLGVDRGWFMLQDFLAAMPLSIFVLANYVPTSLDRAEIMSYLTDPVKRHLCIGYLPTHMREIIMKEKKVVKQLQHAFFVLGAMGLLAVGPNPSIKRFPGASSDMFYIAKKTHLYDTSTSSKGYACVNPAVDSGFYVRYEYVFETRTDIILYWHHLRAIIQSTPLSYRMDDIGEQKCATRHKQYSIGVFDRKIIEHDCVPGIEKVYPRLLADGVAGFDGALFIHLKRHWDLITIPHSTTAWFIAKFRKCSQEMKRIIEARVKSVHKDWIKFTKLNISDVDFMRSSNPLKVEYPTKPTIKKALNPLKPKPIANLTAPFIKNNKPKKRKLDSVDIVSASARISVRCRFSPKERDQLIMIRAVGFFLNPVYRFWLDPTVLRDLMHEFVPESRNKTVQSLMACGVRELVRAHRLAYLQRIVRNLSTFPEMRRLRSELCASPVTPGKSKTEFFKDAFRIAMRLLFVDNDRIPSCTITDANFRLFLQKGRVSVTKEITVSNTIPRRSQKPISYSHIQHCVASNILVSVLLHTKNGAVPDKLISQVPPAVLQTALHSLRTDGLVSRSRSMETMAELNNKKDATLSYYFRHFFAHRFHSDLVENSGRLLDEVEDENASEIIELKGDGPEVVVAAANTFHAEKFSLEMHVDDDILDAFSKLDTDNSQKKIRYLESADLHFEKIRVILERLPVPESSEVSTVPPKDINTVLTYLDSSRPVRDPITLDECIQSGNYDLNRRREMRAVVHVVKASKQVGITLEKLGGKVKIPVERIKIILNDLHQGRQIILVGVDEPRWVMIEYEACWTVILGEKRWCPRPWVDPEGKISLAVVRWIAESVLLMIVGRVGVQLEDVFTTYEFAVQPIAIREIIGLLEHLECIEIIKKEFVSPKMSSPFDPPTETQTINYIHPIVDGVEKFSRIFHQVELMSLMTAKNNL